MMHAIERIFQLKYDSTYYIKSIGSIDLLNSVSPYGYLSRNNISILPYVIPLASSVMYHLLYNYTRVAIDSSFSCKNKRVLNYLSFRNIMIKLFNRTKISLFRCYLL